MTDSGEMAREMERVCRALDEAGVHLAGEDQAESARQLNERVRYSPLRTTVERAAPVTDGEEQGGRSRGDVGPWCADRRHRLEGGRERQHGAAAPADWPICHESSTARCWASPRSRDVGCLIRWRLHATSGHTTIATRQTLVLFGIHEHRARNDKPLAR